MNTAKCFGMLINVESGLILCSVYVSQDVLGKGKKRGFKGLFGRPLPTAPRFRAHSSCG